jgi:hypothetical protein
MLPSLHRNNVSGSKETVQLSINCDHDENMNIINSQHDENMKKLENQH